MKRRAVHLCFYYETVNESWPLDSEEGIKEYICRMVQQ